MKRVFALVVSSVMVAACGAAGTGSAPPRAPQMTTPAGAGYEERTIGITQAKLELRQAEIELSQGQIECASACKALASMERATQHLCDLAASADDRRACDDARQKLVSSRERVRSTCGECVH